MNIVKVNKEIAKLFNWLLKANRNDGNGSPILSQVCLAKDHYVATDGFRIHATKVSVDDVPSNGTAKFEVLSNFSVLLKDDTGKQVSLERYDKALYFEHYPDNKFPDLKKVLPDRNGEERKHIALDVDYLKDALSAMSGTVTIAFSDDNKVVELYGHSLDDYSLYVAIMPKHITNQNSGWRP